MRNELISVIVPVYNCEEYLRECLDSICSQTYKNLEIILIDDGSKDKSGIICDEYAQKDNRIIVIHQNNAGQQAAQDRGIQIAKGKYMGFVDSDDWVDSEMFNFLVDKIDDADMITSGIYRNDISGKIVDVWTDLFEEGVYDTGEDFFLNNLLIKDTYESGTVMGGISNNKVDKLYSTDIVKKISAKVNQGISIEEDLFFNILFILNCKKVRVTHEVFYHYRFNPQSVITNASKNFLLERDIFYKTIMNEIDQNPEKKMIKKKFQRRFLNSIYADIPVRLGISEELWYPQYIFPEKEILVGKKIIIFGAGMVGKAFISDMKRTPGIELVLWLDNSCEYKQGENICEELIPQNPQILRDYDGQYDYIICAVQNENSGNGIIKQLVSMGIAEEKLIWKAPVNIWNQFFIQNR